MRINQKTINLPGYYKILILDTVLYNRQRDKNIYNVVKRGEWVKTALSCEEHEKQFAEDAWLNYFNRYLFEHGTISEKEYKKMTEKIANRKAKSSRHGSAI